MPIETTRQQQLQCADLVLRALVARIPFIQFMQISFERRGNELTALFPYHEQFIGNPNPAALHGGATAGLLEITAIVQLTWATLQPQIEALTVDPAQLQAETLAQSVALPKTIDISVDYLSRGQPQDAYARAKVSRSGRRYASVLVEAWQDDVQRPFAHATGHFLMPAVP